MHKEAKRILILSFSLATAFVFAGCGDDLGDCPTDSTVLQNNGKAIVQSKCATAGCHSSANGAMASGGLDFSSDSVIKTNAATMYGEAEEGAMPPAGKLNDADLEALRAYLACTQ